MYWPYLRNRTNEVFAIQELAPTIAVNRLVVPIFNLLSVDHVFVNRITEVANRGQRFCLLVNSNPAVSSSSVYALLAQLDQSFPGMALPGIEILSSTTPLEVSSFATKYAATQCVVVHRSASLETSLQSLLANLSIPAVHVYFASAFITNKISAVSSSGNVILPDAFQRQAINGAYPSNSTFNNYCATYAQYNYQGFGDFAAIGDHFKAGGGQASHVALHLTEIIGNGAQCNHFVSHGIATSSHIHAKYDDALSQLRAYVANSSGPDFSTAGVANYLAPHTYPGLGMPKRWSLKHHVELMNRLLLQSSVQPFV